jgi:hypothetical protein
MSGEAVHGRQSLRFDIVSGNYVCDADREIQECRDLFFLLAVTVRVFTYTYKRSRYYLLRYDKAPLRPAGADPLGQIVSNILPNTVQCCVKSGEK